MSPEAAQIIEEWRVYNETQFEKLINLLKKEAVQDILERIMPNAGELMDRREAEGNKKAAEVVPGEEQKISPDTLRKLMAGRKPPTAPTKVVYANPEDDPNYGSLNSDAVSSGSAPLNI